MASRTFSRSYGQIRVLHKIIGPTTHRAIAIAILAQARCSHWFVLWLQRPERYSITSPFHESIYRIFLGLLGGVRSSLAAMFDDVEVRRFQGNTTKYEFTWVPDARLSEVPASSMNATTETASPQDRSHDRSSHHHLDHQLPYHQLVYQQLSLIRVPFKTSTIHLRSECMSSLDVFEHFSCWKKFLNIGYNDI